MKLSITNSKGKLNALRNLSFEIGTECDRTVDHPQCPINHPERYKYGDLTRPLSNELLIEFWKWARAKGFRGYVEFGGYNEPTLYLKRANTIVDMVRTIDPNQPFKLYTNHYPLLTSLARFDVIRVTCYDADQALDDRRLTTVGEGKKYGELPKSGWCGHGYLWEIYIDFFGNWLMCCNDWRCEESFGNLYTHDWDEMLQRYEERTQTLYWDSEATYNALPRLCRACLDKCYSLHYSGSM
jgi:hypothetical protein